MRGGPEPSASHRHYAYVHVSLMVNLHLKSQKLIERGISVVGGVMQSYRDLALRTLKFAGLNLPVALVMLKHDALPGNWWRC